MQINSTYLRSSSAHALRTSACTNCACLLIDACFSMHAYAVCTRLSASSGSRICIGGPAPCPPARCGGLAGAVRTLARGPPHGHCRANSQQRHLGPP